MENCQQEIEEDIKNLTKATHENSSSIREMNAILRSFMEPSKEQISQKFLQIDEIINDHESRIRSNTKAVYQGAAIISTIIVLLNVIKGLI
ncbi:hypothetical protein SAMN02745150_00617 [Brevinema andersonii]|uniref:Uncharacterized protein n=1 Tax=Brevinema andersonii TaxID=34097 RepID=A0A1I1DJX4_BREAD|nr:hypothetical protein [Brevinema andersonii]SFB75269.1 hypothetical protein SAMN02745150_00617 [Brevinema andersonii]